MTTWPTSRVEALADDLLARLDGCDLCGFNVKRFDLQLLYNEFHRAGQSFALDGRAVIDPQEIFHTHEPRDLGAAVSSISAVSTPERIPPPRTCWRRRRSSTPCSPVTADLKRDAEGLHAQFQDPDAVDSAGFFTRGWRD